eukprot:8225320-Pyramimonas_sp.AAC.1
MMLRMMMTVSGLLALATMVVTKRMATTMLLRVAHAQCDTRGRYSGEDVMMMMVTMLRMAMVMIMLMTMMLTDGADFESVLGEALVPAPPPRGRQGAFLFSVLAQFAATSGKVRRFTDPTPPA